MGDLTLFFVAITITSKERIFKQAIFATMLVYYSKERIDYEILYCYLWLPNECARV